MQETQGSNLGRSPGEGNGYSLQYSCLKNFMDREAWQATVHGLQSPWVAKSMGCKVHGLDMTATNNNLYILQSKAKSYSPSDIRNLMYSIRKLPLFSALFSVENVYSEKTELLDSSC